METFAFPLHTFATKYPESSATVTFGRGYSFASRPRGPDQKTYTLSFAGMWFYETAPGVVDTTSNPTINMAILDAFYQAHRLYEPFIYPHPAEGDVVVRFAKPLAYKQKPNGKGQVEPFEIELILLP